jgi:hypothetical protein
MGGNSSKTRSLNKTINDTATSVIKKIAQDSNSTASNVINANITATGSSKISNVRANQEAIATVNVMLNSNANKSMQTDLINEISSKLKVEKETMPSISNKSDDVIENVVKTTVTTKMKDTTTQLAHAKANNLLNLNIDSSVAGNVTDVNFDQVASSITKMVGGISDSIEFNLTGQNEDTTDQEVKQTSGLAGIAESAINAIKGVFSQPSKMVMMVVVGLIIIVSMIYMFKGKKSSSSGGGKIDPVINAGTPFNLASFGIGSNLINAH